MFDWLLHFPTPGQISESLASPQRYHGALVHLPLGVCVLGVVLTFLMLVVRGSNALRWATVVVLLVGAASAFMASRAGGKAADAVGVVGLSEPARASLEAHELMGQWAWVFFTVGAASVAISAAPKPSVRAGMTILSFLIALASLAWVGAAGYHGGELVYVHGVGVPLPAADAKPQAASPPDPAVENGDAQREGPDGHVDEPGAGH